MSAVEEARQKVQEEMGRYADFRHTVNTGGSDNGDGTRELEMKELIPKLTPVIKAQHEAIVALLLALEEVDDR